ncbi:6-carboxytetrahydropterin synthase QueD [Desulfatirhabdium butyrativorans]|uniref:6-carboxytetrahydropterin synthase QueD n=1 Tax=Desulfatirhabdium butyrativorans TaxID=340467 RepID=UPI00040B37C7|nr:6-carboxytetrahydropterin synthase QueD [Desulfatirhabdium butyrativorans]
MYELTVITQFAAAHQLKMVAKKCENLHGHNWKVEVSVCGQHLNEAGVLIDFVELKRHVNDVIDRLDHRFLNELGVFSDDFPPSSENIARFIATEIDSKLEGTGVRVSRVRTWESDSASATYIP